jgi:hypothetical protein
MRKIIVKYVNMISYLMALDARKRILSGVLWPLFTLRKNSSLDFAITIPLHAIYCIHNAYVK